MNFPRSTLRTALHVLIQERQILERQWGYTSNSAYLASLKELYEKTESEVSVINLF